jgi:hypothetical protein
MAASARQNAAPLEPLAKNTGNNDEIQGAQAAPLEPLAKSAENCDEIRESKAELTAPLAGMGAKTSVPEGQGTAGFLPGVIEAKKE